MTKIYLHYVQYFIQFMIQQQQDTEKKVLNSWEKIIHNKEFNHICKYYSVCLESPGVSAGLVLLHFLS